MNTDRKQPSVWIGVHLWFHFPSRRAATEVMEYISSADQKTLNARYQNTALVGVALGASAMLYLVIGRLISPPATTMDAAQIKTLSYVLYSVALVVSLAVVFLRRWLMAR